MDILYELIFGSSIPHTIFILSVTLCIGIALGKVKIAGISFGVTWVLFVGVVLSHFGMTADSTLLFFARDFGLILFIYSIGLQVGPGFFTSFKKGGIKLNILAIGIIFGGVLVTGILHIITRIPITTMAGIMSGAVTNTPGLGAAQQAALNITGVIDPSMATGYAVAYPVSVIAVVLLTVLFRYMFKVECKKEADELLRKGDDKAAPRTCSLHVENPALNGMRVGDIHKLINRNYVISRIRHNDKVEMATSETVLHTGDDILVVTSVSAAPAVAAFIGREIDLKWDNMNTELTLKQVIVTQSKINGKTLAQLRLRNLGVNIIRISRAGIELAPYPGLDLLIGDYVTIVGTEAAVERVEAILGNSAKKLNEANLLVIFFGISLGIIVGSISVKLPGMSQSLKLGFAGGPLVVSILISRFGPKFRLVTYTPEAAIFTLRDMGIAVFLACVGLSSGADFFQAIAGGGYIWIVYGLIITIVPVFIAGIIGRVFMKLNYFLLCGMISGAMTNAPALAHVNSLSDNDAASAGYAIVYPLTMFMRILCGQIIILIFL